MKHHNSDGTKPLLVTLVAMGLLVAVSLVADERRRRGHRAAASEFQQLVGGLGLGPDTNWETCAHGFDPRISADCAYNSGPLLGGSTLCPYRTTSILSPPALAIEPNEHADIP